MSMLSSNVDEQAKGKKVESKQENEDVNGDRHSDSGNEEELFCKEPVMESTPAALNGRVLASAPSEEAAEDEDDKAMPSLTPTGSAGKKVKFGVSVKQLVLVSIVEQEEEVWRSSAF